MNNYDHAPALNSFAQELLFEKNEKHFWSRLEVLQRTPAELAIAASDPNRGRWVTVVTAGYTHTIHSWTTTDLSLGTSLSKAFLPEAFRTSYSGDPWSFRVFAQVNTMNMWEL